MPFPCTAGNPDAVFSGSFGRPDTALRAIVVAQMSGAVRESADRWFIDGFHADLELREGADCARLK